MLLRALLLLSAALALPACGGSAPPAAPLTPTASAAVIVVQPAPRARNDESDAWGPGGQSGSAASKPPVDCPAGSRFNGATCVSTEVTCPAGSKRVQNTCVGDVSCPGSTTWDGETCRASGPPAATGTTPTSLAAPPPSSCFLNINSIPASQVHIDGVPVGWTPRLHAPVSSGSHTVLFISDRGKKSVTTSCSVGETKSVVARFQVDETGY